MPRIHLNALCPASIESKIGVMQSRQPHSNATETSNNRYIDDANIVGRGVQSMNRKLSSSQSQDHQKKIHHLDDEVNSSFRAGTFLVSHEKNVTYPFQSVKPGGFEGETTLKDINKLILKNPSTSSSSKAIPQPVRDSVTHHPRKSAKVSSISGKVVASHTIIHTQGGGSIAITRTKDRSEPSSMHIHSVNPRGYMSSQ